ncbi:vesicle-associated protein 4-1 isoform X2 [Physcomitrium patens]|uniref:MSP domain-containing protein n=1 Tax=Physcomitrium patens TaxID=3218 RepID=A0A7I4EHK5_PHYPA|nr:vesicle-associated protein 4-1-like isoform X2 [Physcomitrium patens]|eukprot:XP_024384577.1 vesicle-associated protein 4-1-like isoform X2 [Physcomitrella patens]
MASSEKQNSEERLFQQASPQPWKLKMPWERSSSAEGAKSTSAHTQSVKKRSLYEHPFLQDTLLKEEADAAAAAATANVSSLASLKALLLTRRRLRLDPEKHLYFLYDPGKQVSTAIKIKNVSRTHVAFKFQTTAPKSCFMRPNSGVLAPNESIIATVVKYIEPMTGSQERKTKEKFKIVSLAVKPDIEYAPELFDHQRDIVSVERILRVVFVDPNKASPEVLNRLQTRLAEAEAAEAARLQPEKEEVPKTTMVQEGLVIDEWASSGLQIGGITEETTQRRLSRPSTGRRRRVFMRLRVVKVRSRNRSQYSKLERAKEW